MLDRSVARVKSVLGCVAVLWDRKMVQPLPPATIQGLNTRFGQAAGQGVAALKAKLHTHGGQLVQLSATAEW